MYRVSLAFYGSFPLMKSHELKKKMETDGLSLGYSLRFFCGFKTALFGAKEVGVKGQRSWC